MLENSVLPSVDFSPLFSMGRCVEFFRRFALSDIVDLCCKYRNPSCSDVGRQTEKDIVSLYFSGEQYLKQMLCRLFFLAHVHCDV